MTVVLNVLGVVAGLIALFGAMTAGVYVARRGGANASPDVIRTVAAVMGAVAFFFILSTSLLSLR